MKLRRAIGFAVLGYVITMVVGLGIGFISGTDMTQMMQDPPAWCWVISAIMAIIITGLMAHLYFRSTRVMKGADQGIYFGVIAVIVGFLLDTLTIVPTFGWKPLIQYYTMPIFRGTLILVVITAAIIGKNARRH